MASSVDDRAALYRPIFVGREAELQHLQSAFQAATQGRPAVLAIAGEPGIGKTALCTQLATHVSNRGGRTLWGHCAEVDAWSIAYAPIIQALDSYSSSLAVEQLQDNLGSSASVLARLVPQIQERLGIQVEVAVDPEEERWRLFQAVVTFLRSGAARQPILLALEDLHAADRGTLDLLTHLTRHIGDARLLVVGTYRDVEVDRAHPLSSTLAELRRLPHFARVGLHGLTVAEVHQFYRQMRGQDVPLSRAETVHQQTEGNPLFVQEVLRYLVEIGLVVPHDGAYVPRDISLIEAEVPEGLRDIVGKRLNHLTERTNEVLHIAAVIGQEFRLDVLQQVCGLDEEQLFEALEEAQARAILDESGGFGTSPRFRFTHAFFRQTLYEEIFAPRRIRLHRLIGSILEQIYAEHVDDHAGELAAHFAHSSDPSDLVRAMRFDQRAADQAVRVYAYGEAARHLERALQVETVLEVRQPLTRCDLLVALGEAMLAMDHSPGIVTRIAEEAFELADSNCDGQRAARAAVLALEVLSRPWLPTNLHGTPEELKWVERVDRFAAQNTVDRVYADVWLGMYATASGQPAQVTAPLLRAVDLASRLGDESAYGAAVGYALMHLLALSQVDVLLRLAREFMSRPHARMRIAHVAHALWAAARILLGSGDRRAAERAWDELDHVATQTREPAVHLQAMPNRATRAFLDGDLETAAAELESITGFAAGLARELRASSYHRIASIRALYYLGRTGDWLLDESPGERRGELAGRALLRAMLGRRDDVFALRSRFSGIERPEDATALVMLSLLFESAVMCKDTSTAEVLFNRLTPLANRIDGVNLVSYGRLLGEAATLLGRPAAARDNFEQALAICQRVAFRPELALIRLDIAELLLNNYPSEQALAADYLQAAITELEAMGMRPGLSRALELAESAALAPGAPAVKKLPESAEPLTEREREVATLLAQGMSNRDIAAQLVITESTTEVHVKHILSKLGLKSRSQVAAWAVQRKR